MTIVDMLGQSALLTGLGMGVVFGFLIILIIFMTITSKVIKALGLDKDAPKATAGNTSAAPAQNNNAVVAAIAAALREKESK
ncbi:MAG: OadG family protein [Spirochaetaceae bacterium]|nr:OadG family protein [Spirochaetaceae bacterium]